MADVVKCLLAEEEIPKSKYNIAADLPAPAPPPHPGTLNPLGPDDLAPLFFNVAHHEGGVCRARDRDSKASA
jgi:tryptophan synthase beta chain